MCTNNEKNDQFYRKVAFLMYSERVNFRPQSWKEASKLKPHRGLGTTIVDRIYWDNYEKRYFFASHKQLKTLLREHMVKLKIISLYIYKDLRLKT